MAETQHEKIIKLCEDGNYHCQNEFRALYIFSPHKRRSEIETETKYRFLKRKCEHGFKRQFDYKMIEKKQTELGRIMSEWQKKSVQIKLI
jgi:hypothetical protein